MEPMPVRVAIALGSNLSSQAGDSRATVLAALDELARVRCTHLLAASSLHTTAPVGPPQPAYINAAAVVETGLTPRELLIELHEIERRFGRDRSREQRWGPRTLDLDIVLFGDTVLDEAGLHIPHPRMHERAFVLIPLNEVAPEVVHPSLGRTVSELLSGLIRAE